jgi:hypothetical protein
VAQYSFLKMENLRFKIRISGQVPLVEKQKASYRSEEFEFLHKSHAT